MPGDGEDDYGDADGEDEGEDDDDEVGGDWWGR